jgi:hypothetical protein
MESSLENRRGGPLVRAVLLSLLVAGAAAPARAQMIDDGIMVPPKAMFTGVLYGHDRWSEYWEGTLKRENENVGTLRTSSVTWMANYGLNSHVNLIAMLPYVSTEASGGTLHPQSGLQDLTLAAKGRLFTAGSGKAYWHGFAVASYGTPASDYVADLLPLSIGLHSRRFTGRLTMQYRRESGWFADATAAYTWRGNVTLDRPSYFTDGQLFLTDQVEMPDVFDSTVRAGYMNRSWMFPVSYSRQVTRGGGDIRRQDMPFVSNRMNFSKVEAMARYTLPRPAFLGLQVHVTKTLEGRNVGDSTTLGAGLVYTLHFSK